MDKSYHLRRAQYFVDVMRNNGFPEQGPVVGVEIGVLKADFSHAMLTILPNLKMFMVDPYSPDFKRWGRLGKKNTDKLVQKIIEKMSIFGDRAVFLREYSVEAARKFEGLLDYGFIDGRHDYESVKQDITIWEPHIRSGGILSGHDYSNAPSAGGGGVIRAVDEYAEGNKRGLCLSDFDALWYWIKP